MHQSGASRESMGAETGTGRRTPIIPSGSKAPVTPPASTATPTVASALNNEANSVTNSAVSNNILPDMNTLIEIDEGSSVTTRDFAELGLLINNPPLPARSAFEGPPLPIDPHIYFDLHFDNEPLNHAAPGNLDPAEPQGLRNSYLVSQVGGDSSTTLSPGVAYNAYLNAEAPNDLSGLDTSSLFPDISLYMTGFDPILAGSAGNDPSTAQTQFMTPLEDEPTLSSASLLPREQQLTSEPYVFSGLLADFMSESFQDLHAGGLHDPNQPPFPSTAHTIPATYVTQPLVHVWPMRQHQQSVSQMLQQDTTGLPPSLSDTPRSVLSTTPLLTDSSGRHSSEQHALVTTPSPSIWYRQTLDTRQSVSPNPRPSKRRTLTQQGPQAESPSSGDFKKHLHNFTTTRARKPFQASRRYEVAVTRKVGACFNCRMWKVSCSPGRPCDRCSQKKEAGSVLLQPCFKLDLSDCSFFRPGSCVHSDRATTDMDWITMGITTLKFSPTSLKYPSRPIEVPCRHFMPRENHVVIKYVGGNDPTEFITVPAYATIDMSTIAKQVSANALEYFEIFMTEIMETSKQDVVEKTLRIALHRASRHPKSILNAAVKVWVGSKLCATERCLVGTELLGLQPVKDEKSPLFQGVPIPPVLDFQTDSTIIEWMTVMSQLIFKSLWQMVSCRNRKDWFEVFLTVFVILNNIEYVYAIQIDYVKYLEASGKASAVKTWSEQIMQHWKWSASHFLYIYRSFVTKLPFPFSPSAVSAIIDDCHLDREESCYLYDILTLQAKILAEQPSFDDTVDYEMLFCADLFKR